MDVEEEEKSSKLLRKPSVFDRIGRPTSQISVFDRLETHEDNNFVIVTQGSVLTRLNHSTLSQVSTQGSILTRLSHSTPSQLLKDVKIRQKQSKMSNFHSRDLDNTLIFYQDSNEIQNSIPSRMKRKSIWEVNTREALIAKKHTMVITKQEIEDDVVTSMNHVTIVEDSKEKPPIGDNIEDAPPIFEEGIQIIVNELKEINTNTTEDVLRIGPINGKFLKRYNA